MTIAEYKRYYALMYLKKRSRRYPRGASPVDQYYRWWIAYFVTTESDVVRRLISWRPFGRKGRGFYKNVINDPEVQVVLPAHSPEYYVEFARLMNCEVRFYTKRLKVMPSDKKRIKVNAPLIAFNTEPDMYKHILFSTALATVKNPSLYATSIGNEVLRRPSWSDWLGLGVCDRFSEKRYTNYMKSGLNWVLRIGRGFRVLVGLD